MGLFGSALGLSSQATIQWCSWLLSIHDLGKFAESFQGQRSDLLANLKGVQAKRGYTVRHDTLGFMLWRKLWPGLKDEDLLRLGQYERVPYALEAFVRAVTGHHGAPPRESKLDYRQHFAASDEAAARGFLLEAYELLVDDSSCREWPGKPNRQFGAYARLLSYWLAGVAVLADWLGSNQTYFEYRDRPVPLPEYWPRALERADEAITASGVLAVQASTKIGFHDLFDLPDAVPTPLQRLATELDVGPGPQLFVLEDVTGTGKTEASMLLAARLLALGLSAGIYDGLPTMATANAMYERMATVYRRLFTADSDPSLALAHSAAGLSAAFRRSVVPDDPTPPDPKESDETASARCTAWLADNRKRALLAQMGVGTLDQALQAILPNRHQSLRLLGLFRKVLIVDEVHAYDAYMNRLLQRLLEAHALSGGSAILLSATLPRRTRRELLAAFAKGRRWAKAETREHGYPLLTHLASENELNEYPLAACDSARRRVKVTCLGNEAEVIERIRRQAGSGSCVCWIRNTVHDAVEAYERLAGLGADVELFHARFALGDRLAIEDRVLRHFGPKSDHKSRRGRIVVATQVVEQSLDLDFDLLITDLAPIDALIQRAGRLFRHLRDVLGNRSNEEGRGAPEMIVYGPDCAGAVSANWYEDCFPKGAFVYPDHGRLWLGAQWLRGRGAFSMPDDAREMIEYVYGDDVVSTMPEALRERHLSAEGSKRGDASSAAMNALNLEDGYRLGTVIDWWEDALTPTRLGEETVTMRVFRWDGGCLRPWCDGEDALHLSQVQVRQNLASQPVPPHEADRLAAWTEMLESLPDKGKWSVPVGFEFRSGICKGTTLDERGGSVEWVYEKERGLQRPQN